MARQRRPGLTRVDVRGKTVRLWNKLRSNLIMAINQVLDTVIDKDEQSTLRDEARALTVGLLDYAKAKLAREGLENSKIEVEIKKTYAEIESGKANARLQHATADEAEFRLKCRKLKLSLGMAQALLIGDDGEEAILFSRRIDKMLEVLKELV